MRDDEKNIHTVLVAKHSQFPTVCIYCNKQIPANNLYYVEKGITRHIHSLIARKYCEECYNKYSEKLLLYDLKE